MNKIWKIGTDINSYIKEIIYLAEKHGYRFELLHSKTDKSIKFKFDDGHVEVKTKSTASQFIRVLLALEFIVGNKNYYKFDKSVLQDDTFTIVKLNLNETMGDFLCVSLKNKVISNFKDETSLFPSEKKLVFSIMSTIFGAESQKNKKFLNLRIYNSSISEIEKYYLSISKIISSSSQYKNLLEDTVEYIVGFTEESRKVVESVNSNISRETSILYSEKNLEEQIVSNPETFGMFIESYFAKKTKIEIPVYQRKYIWPESTVKTLLNDIKDIGQSIGTHYMGNIIVKKQDNGLETIIRIVDGQQRITTLTLISRALFDFAKYKKFPVDKLFNTKFAIDGEDNDGNPSNDIIETFMRVKGNDDYNAFKLVMRGDAFSKDAKTNSSQIIENYKVILNWISQNLSSENNLEIFWKSLLNKITMVVINSKSSNEYKLFEKLNTGATPLTTLELFKNYILDSFSGEKINDKRAQFLFEEKIESHFNNVGKDKEIEKFIITYLRVNNSSIGNETIFNQFKDLIEQKYINNRPDFSLSNVLEKLSEDIIIYKTISTYSIYTKKDSWAYNIADFLYMFDGRTVYYPIFIRLIKYYFEDLKKGEIERINSLRDYLRILEIFEVRIQVANYRGQSLSGTIEQILLSLNDSSTPKDLWNMLSGIESKSTAMPSIDLLHNELSNSPIANKPAKLVMTRLEIYYKLKNNWHIDKDTNFTILYNKPSQREHLLPAQWKEYWKEKLEEQTGLFGEALEDEIIKYRDFIGNAFPIPAWSNNQVKNQSLAVKTSKFQKTNYSKFTLMFNGIPNVLNPVNTKFGPSEISERSIQIANIAKLIWSNPFE